MAGSVIDKLYICQACDRNYGYTCIQYTVTHNLKYKYKHSQLQLGMKFHS